MGGDRAFVPLVEVFEASYKEIFPKHSIEKSPSEGARILAEAHDCAAPFPEVERVVSEIGRSRRTCIISDTDEVMIREQGIEPGGP